MSWQVGDQGEWCSSSPKVCRLEIQEEQMFQSEPKDRKKPMSQFEGNQTEEILRRINVFVLFGPLTDCMRPTYIREGNLLQMLI